jgi:hypothetical protein
MFRHQLWRFVLASLLCAASAHSQRGELTAEKSTAEESTAEEKEIERREIELRPKRQNGPPRVTTKVIRIERARELTPSLASFESRRVPLVEAGRPHGRTETGRIARPSAMKPTELSTFQSQPARFELGGDRKAVPLFREVPTSSQVAGLHTDVVQISRLEDFKLSRAKIAEKNPDVLVLHMRTNRASEATLNAPARTLRVFTAMPQSPDEAAAVHGPDGRLVPPAMWSGLRKDLGTTGAVIVDLAKTSGGEATQMADRVRNALSKPAEVGQIDVIVAHSVAGTIYYPDGSRDELRALSNRITRPTIFVTCNGLAHLVPPLAHDSGHAPVAVGTEDQQAGPTTATIAPVPQPTAAPTTPPPLAVGSGKPIEYTDSVDVVRRLQRLLQKPTTLKSLLKGMQKDQLLQRFAGVTEIDCALPVFA